MHAGVFQGEHARADLFQRLISTLSICVNAGGEIGIRLTYIFNHFCRNICFELDENNVCDGHGGCECFR